MKLSIGLYGDSNIDSLLMLSSNYVFLADMALDKCSTFKNNKKKIVGRVTVQSEPDKVDSRFRKFAQQPLGRDAQESYILGTEFASLLCTYYPLVDIWQLYNESVSDGDWEGYKKLCNFELGATRELHRHGVKSCVLNFAVGNCFPDDYPRYFSPLLDEADYIGFHAYGSPSNQLMSKDSQWYALRYQLVSSACEKVGKRFPPVIITECTTYSPWRGKFSSQEIANDIVWLGNIIWEDTRVVVAFGFQMSHPSPQWNGFDLNDSTILNSIRNWNNTHSAPPPPVQPSIDVVFGNNYRIRDARNIVPRKGSYSKRNLSDVKYIVIHHTGVGGDSSAKSIAEYCINNNGWPYAGYHILIHYPSGEAELLNDFESASYNVAYRNHEVIGVALCGDYSNDIPTGQMIYKTREIVSEIQFMLGWFCPVVGHREIADSRAPTACPGYTWEIWKPKVSVEPPSKYTYVLGFKNLALSLGMDFVGEPLENEHRESLMVQRSTNGIFIYDGKTSEFYLRRK